MMMMTMTTNQVHDDLGQLDCAKSPTTLSREGAAAGFFQPADLSGICREFVLYLSDNNLVFVYHLGWLHCI